MLSRILLSLILLLPAMRGVVVAQPAGGPLGLSAVVGWNGEAAVCGASCCPLCEALGSCPCVADSDDRIPMPDPVLPITKGELPGGLVSPPSVRPGRAVAVSKPRAPPVTGSLRAMDATVGRFLSRVCVWTT